MLIIRALPMAAAAPPSRSLLGLLCTPKTRVHPAGASQGRFVPQDSGSSSWSLLGPLCTPKTRVHPARAFRVTLHPQNSCKYSWSLQRPLCTPKTQANLARSRPVSQGGWKGTGCMNTSSQSHSSLSRFAQRGVSSLLPP